MGHQHIMHIFRAYFGKFQLEKWQLITDSTMGFITMKLPFGRFFLDLFSKHLQSKSNDVEWGTSRVNALYCHESGYSPFKFGFHANFQGGYYLGV